MNTDSLRKIIDNDLLQIIDKECSVKPFKCFLDSILKETRISIESTFAENKKSLLSVACEEKDGYQKVIYLVHYIRELISHNYLEMILPSPYNNKEEEVKLGDSTETQKGVLPKDYSEFIVEHLACNIIVLPEFKEYVKAGHISQELRAAKNNATASRVSALVSIIATIISLVAVCKG